MPGQSDPATECYGQILQIKCSNQVPSYEVLKIIGCHLSLWMVMTIRAALRLVTFRLDIPACALLETWALAAKPSKRVGFGVLGDPKIQKLPIFVGNSPAELVKLLVIH